MTFMNRVLREERTEGWGILPIEDLHELFPLPSVIRLIKSSEMERVHNFIHSTWGGETTWETAVADKWTGSASLKINSITVAQRHVVRNSSVTDMTGRSRWQCDLRSGSVVARFLGLRVQISMRVRMFFSCVCYVLCKQWAPSVTSRSLVQSFWMCVCVCVRIISKPQQWGSICPICLLRHRKY
jgi:hypothetical protein